MLYGLYLCPRPLNQSREIGKTVLTYLAASAICLRTAEPKLNTYPCKVKLPKSLGSCLTELLYKWSVCGVYQVQTSTQTLSVWMSFLNIKSAQFNKHLSAVIQACGSKDPSVMKTVNNTNK